MYKLVPLNKIPVAEPVDETDLIPVFKLATALGVLCVKEGGVGLSAVQAGVPLHLFVIKNNITADHYMNGFAYIINARYEPVDVAKYESLEGCLSLKDKYYSVPRYASIRVIGKQLIAKNNIELKDIDTVFEKGVAAVYAHEIDHGFGTTIDKIGTLIKARKR
jgi:peptide deformylase